MLRTVLRPLGIGALLCSTVGASAPPDSASAGLRPRIIGSTSSDDAQDATVLLFALDPAKPERLGICTASLIAPRLVLTARHCVSRTDQDVACAPDGTPIGGGAVYGNRPAPDLYVFTGRKRPELIGAAPPTLDPANWKPSGRGAEILDDGAGTLCNHDIALLLLEKPIENVPLAVLRLDRDAKAGEKLLTVGWGVSSGEVEPSARQQRRDVTVKRVGPSDAFPALTKSELLFDESICLGDSGGPVFAQATNAIVGVVSRGSNGADPSKGGPAATCTEADNIATKLSPFRSLFDEGFRRAGASPILEPPPADDEGCAVASVGVGRSGAGSFSAFLALALAAAGFVRRVVRSDCAESASDRARRSHDRGM